MTKPSYKKNGLCALLVLAFIAQTSIPGSTRTAVTAYNHSNYSALSPSYKFSSRTRIEKALSIDALFDEIFEEAKDPMQSGNFLYYHGLTGNLDVTYIGGLPEDLSVLENYAKKLMQANLENITDPDQKIKAVVSRILLGTILVTSLAAALSAATKAKGNKAVKVWADQNAFAPLFHGMLYLCERAEKEIACRSMVSEGASGGSVTFDPENLLRAVRNMGRFIKNFDAVIAQASDPIELTNGIVNAGLLEVARSSSVLASIFIPKEDLNRVPSMPDKNDAYALRLIYSAILSQKNAELERTGNSKLFTLDTSPEELLQNTVYLLNQLNPRERRQLMSQLSYPKDDRFDRIISGEQQFGLQDITVALLWRERSWSHLRHFILGGLDIVGSAPPMTYKPVVSWDNYGGALLEKLLRAHSIFEQGNTLDHVSTYHLMRAASLLREDSSNEELQFIFNCLYDAFCSYLNKNVKDEGTRFGNLFLCQNGELNTSPSSAANLTMISLSGGGSAESSIHAIVSRITRQILRIRFINRDATNAIDDVRARVKALAELSEYRSGSSLDFNMEDVETSLSKAGFAAYVLLKKSGIPATRENITSIKPILDSLLKKKEQDADYTSAAQAINTQTGLAIEAKILQEVTVQARTQKTPDIPLGAVHRPVISGILESYIEKMRTSEASTDTASIRRFNFERDILDALLAHIQDIPLSSKQLSALGKAPFVLNTAKTATIELSPDDFMPGMNEQYGLPLAIFVQSFISGPNPSVAGDLNQGAKKVDVSVDIDIQDDSLKNIKGHVAAYTVCVIPGCKGPVTLKMTFPINFPVDNPIECMKICYRFGAYDKASVLWNHCVRTGCFSRFPQLQNLYKSLIDQTKIICSKPNEAGFESFDALNTRAAQELEHVLAQAVELRNELGGRLNIGFLIRHSVSLLKSLYSELGAKNPGYAQKLKVIEQVEQRTLDLQQTPYPQMLINIGNELSLFNIASAA